ncbi:hypothetical protein Dsin_011182 [Dipteronia sinensis]|uniref:Uncharacterized protein n=1 Tax=Dipteronia sinensis TaxID=43782 RepID=A0AAE0AV46_9ROSI|nr:hypothetical protein Dsin_011182 [Dipteronia sinensis]
MLRALSTRRGSHGYERLVDDPSIGLLEGKLKRATSVPASRIFGSSKKLIPIRSTPEFIIKDNSQAVKTTTTNTAKKANKIHPFFSLFDGRRKKKTTSKPEFARYLEYVKEGGIWDVKSNMPVMHYK